jgi:hypothetical protein
MFLARVPSTEKPTARQFRRPESLDLSSDSRAGQDAANLVGMALTGDIPRLKRLYQSGNRVVISSEAI